MTIYLNLAVHTSLPHIVFHTVTFGRLTHGSIDMLFWTVQLIIYTFQSIASCTDCFPV